MAFLLLLILAAIIVNFVGMDAKVKFTFNVIIICLSILAALDLEFGFPYFAPVHVHEVIR